MRQHHGIITKQTRGQGCCDISQDAAAFIDESGVQDGLLTLLIQHTSASLTIQENADPDVQLDLTAALDRLAPESNHLYRHSAEGPDDMPAHIKSALTNTSISIPIMDGRMRLGTWQGIYILEHRRHGHERRVACHIIGE